MISRLTLIAAALGLAVAAGSAAEASAKVATPAHHATHVAHKGHRLHVAHRHHSHKPHLASHTKRHGVVEARSVAKATRTAGKAPVHGQRHAMNQGKGKTPTLTR